MKFQTYGVERNCSVMKIAYYVSVSRKETFPIHSKTDMIKIYQFHIPTIISRAFGPDERT